MTTHRHLVRHLPAGSWKKFWVKYPRSVIQRAENDRQDVRSRKGSLAESKSGKSAISCARPTKQIFMSYHGGMASGEIEKLPFLGLPRVS